MPYEITKNDSDCPSAKPFGVRKKGGGKLHGCHPSQAAARKQQAALYAAESKEQATETITHAVSSDHLGSTTTATDGSTIIYTTLEEKATEPAEAEEIIDEMQEEETEEKDLFTKPELERAYREMYGDRDPDEVMRELLEEQLAQIGMNEEEIEEELGKEAPEEVIEDEATLFERFKEWLKAKPMKTVDGKKYPSSDFLVVEDPQSPNTWHLQVKRNGTPNRGLAAAAWAALFAPGGHRGNKYAGPSKAAAGKKLRALYSSQGWETPSTKEAGLMIWKDADTGQYRWIARYSNNFRDDDNPPEIISAGSHRRFDAMVNKGEAPMPELWLWHRPEWRWGVATWHAYDDAGFPMAAGVVDKGKEPLAEAIMALDPSLVRVSHGMPTDSIRRDPDDESVIVEHVTREISPLPAGAAANHLTGFILFKEATMAIPKDKKDGLVEQWNLSPEVLDQIEAANASDAKEEVEAGTESKEVEPQEPEAAPEAPTPEEAPAAEAPLSREEMHEALEAVGQAIKVLTEQVKALQDETAEAKEIKTVEQAKSLREAFLSVIGHPDARVDGRRSEAKDRPEEHKEKPQLVNTGNPLADSVIGGILDGSWTEGVEH